MMTAAIPVNESERLAALKRYNVLDTDSEKDLEEIVQLASAICQTPISLVSLIDENRQWFKARVGLDVSETSRDISFCAHVLLKNEVMVVENALEDERFSDNPLVTSDPNIRFYAGAPLVTPDGFKLGSLCIIDREPRKLTEQQRFALKTLSKQVIKHFELSLQNKKLHELSKLQNRFLSILSHDMKNPLIGIDGVLNLMASGDISKEDFRELSGEVSVQVKQVLNLLNDIMGWAKSSSDETELVKTSIDLKDLVQDCLELTEVMASQKDTSLHNLVVPGKQIMAHEDMLKFIIRNLLTNAIKFTSKGKVEITSASHPDYWEISVKDTGTGMSEEQLGKLLNPKSRYTSEGTHKEKGSGLGLLLCQEFIKKLGGEMTIKSKQGEGSFFSFSVKK